MENIRQNGDFVMINGIDAAFILNFVVVAGSIIYFVSKLEATTRANKEFYEQSIRSLHENLDNKFIYLERNIDEKFNGVSERFHGIKSDISRLEHKQEESNKIKERLAVAEQAIKEITAKLNMNQVIDTYEAVKKTNS